VLRIGRRTAAGDLHFLANPEPVPVTLTVRTHADEPIVAWDPVTLRREAVPSEDGTAHLTLPPLGSVFVVLGAVAVEPQMTPDLRRPLDGGWLLRLPGAASIPLPAGPIPWTQLGDSHEGFAGVGTYSTAVDVAAELLEDSTVVLALGDVGDVARVRVNGIDCGTVWTSPWQLDVTRALRVGGNVVEIDVANAWMNRLIAESASPTGEIFEPVVGVYAPDAPRYESGLTGPAVLTSYRAGQADDGR
jgi:hypothetical protein